MKKKETDFEELMKNVDYTRWLQALIPVMQPIIIFGAWLGFSMIDKKASAVSKLIALTEPIPGIDLNVPSPVVLASLYHSWTEALSLWPDDFWEFLGPDAKDFFEGITETEIHVPEEGESWYDFIERRLKETGFGFGGKGLA